MGDPFRKYFQVQTNTPYCSRFPSLKSLKKFRQGSRSRSLNEAILEDFLKNPFEWYFRTLFGEFENLTQRPTFYPEVAYIANFRVNIEYSWIITPIYLCYISYVT